jgi:hypothetical protein
VFGFNRAQQTKVPMANKTLWHALTAIWARRLYLVLGFLSAIIAIEVIGALPVLGNLFAAPVAAFFYPIEIEWREGAIWLEAMALRDNIPIYNHSVVAYIYLAHGPMDTLVKSWIAKFVPLLAPWQVTRIFVLCLPIALSICSAIIFRGRIRFYWLWGILVGLTFYVLIMTTPGGYVMLVGRADVTSFVLLTIAITLLHLAIHANTGLVRNVLCVLGGVLIGATYLTLWRSVPALGAMFLVAFIAIGLRIKSWQRAFVAMSLCLAGAVAVFLAVLFGLLDGSLTLFWQHFYKVFFVSFTNDGPSGWLGIPQETWDEFGPGLKSITTDWSSLIRSCIAIVLCPVILCAASFRKLDEAFPYLRNRTFISAFIGLYFLTLSALLFGYLLYFHAGTLNYFVFVYSLAWYMVCLSLASSWRRNLALDGGVAFVVIGVLLCIAVVGIPDTRTGLSGAMMIKRMDAARAFSYELTQLRSQYTVASDAYHFFKERFDHDVIDEGDFAWAFANGKYFDENFSHTVNQYIADLKQNPPDFFVLGLISAPPIRAFVESNYHCVVCGVPFYGYGAQGFSLYARENLPVDELRARFNIFADEGVSSK